MGFGITFGSGIAVCNVHDLISLALADLLDRPQNYMELYNLRHSQAWNVVKRIFGVAKKRFAILWEANEYSMPAQAKIVSACGVIRNFICTYEPDEVLDPGDPEAVDTSPEDARGFMVLATLAGPETCRLQSRERTLQSHVAFIPAGVGEDGEV